jgi:hypothetical protein
MRHWSVRHARGLERIYSALERLLVLAHPAAQAIGYQRLERPVAFVERIVKGFLFDCRMCGQCVLSSTGMSCPMNCPKTLRNGPCGGIRSNGNCEVLPDMPCVWARAWEGSQRMRGSEAIRVIQFAVDHRRQGRSSWLAVMREKGALRAGKAAAGTGA